MPATGIAVVDFGVGADYASVAVIGQAGILAASSRVEAWLDPTQAPGASGRTADEHVMAAALLSVVCRDIVNATGFTVVAVSKSGMLAGKFLLAWAWV